MPSPAMQVHTGIGAKLEPHRRVVFAAGSAQRASKIALCSRGDYGFFGDRRGGVLVELSQGDSRLRASVLFAAAVHCLFLIFLTAFLFNHANPKGDGMEMVAVGAAFMFIFLPLSLPSFVLAKEGRALVVAATLAGLASFAYFAFWLEILDELHLS